MALIDVEDLVGKSFDIKVDDDSISNITIIDAIKNHMENVEENSIYTKFKIKHNKDKFEEVFSYNKLMDHLNNLEDGPIMWGLDRIVSHQGPLDRNHPSYMGSKYNVMVQWENGEITEEPHTIIAADAPVASAIYAKKFNMFEKDQWNRLIRYAKQQGKMFTDVNKIKLRSQHVKPKFKYGIEVPRTWADVICIDTANKNKAWQDEVKKECII